MTGVAAVASPAVARQGAVAVEPASARLAWLDFYRGLAVLVMIETHVANTFLSTAAWPVDWRVWLNYVNGLVAPAFLFIAGYAHACGLRRKRAVRARAGRRLARLGGIAAIGYAMHVPWAELAAGRWPEALLVGTRMDILPCLAASLAVLVVIDRLASRWIDAIVLVLTAGVMIAAPRLADWTGGPVPLLAVLNQNTGSLFPLLPWAAFAFAGFLVSRCAPTFRSFVPLTLAALAFVLFLGRANLSPTSTAFFFERLAWILALVPVCGWIASLAAPGVVLFAGRESLVIYIAHLFAISYLARLGLAPLALGPTTLLFAGILLISLAAALGWRRLSAARADRARRAGRRPENSAPLASLP